MTQPTSSAAPASPTAAQERLLEIIRRLRAEHPDAACALNHESPFQLLIATILSAQCTDERVNQVTPALFARYPTPQAFAEADRAELEEMVRSTGFFRNKAKSIQEASRRLVAEYGGELPQTMDELLTLAGVARKTANVVLGVSYGIADGVVVDTHVRRLAERLGLSAAGAPEKIEQDLMALAPQTEWIDLSHLLIFHGRRVCAARKPNCPACVLRDLCPSVVI